MDVVVVESRTLATPEIKSLLLNQTVVLTLGTAVLCISVLYQLLQESIINEVFPSWKSV